MTNEEATMAEFCAGYNRVHQFIEDLMVKIHRQPEGLFPSPWLSTTAGKFYSRGVCCWDYHHTCLRAATAGEPEYLKYFLENMLAFQTKSGYVPCACNGEDGAEVSVDWHAQPWLAQDAAVYCAMTGDTAHANVHFDQLDAYLKYWFSHARAPLGLYRWRETWMGGIDNEILGTIYPNAGVLSPDLQSLLYMECKAMGYLAKRTGRDGSSYEEKAAAIAEAVNEHLWDEHLGIYSGYNVLDGRVQSSWYDGHDFGDTGKYAYISCPSLYVLFAGIAPRERADRMIQEYVLNPKHFRSRFGIRSLSASSEYYNNAVWGNPPRYSGDWTRMTNSNWQGPVWIPINWFAFHGLLNYGYTQEARRLADDIVALIANSLDTLGFMRENYDAETGRGLYADDFASWNVLTDTFHYYTDAPGKALPLFPWK